MKLERKGTPVKVSGAVGQVGGFQITASRIAFNILSSGLYSNKIGACIRELACNAYDAHVAAGKKNVPFEIHLPTSFEPWFSVKDFGVGLCDGEYPSEANGWKGTGVKGLYCTYFSSDKSNSNDYVGAMGLGSKSPFCYTEGFTITSTFDGVTRIYSSFITEQGTPSVVCQSEEKTPDAPNGLEIQFPVKEEDCWEFENNAKVMLETFNPKPILNTKTEIPAQKYVMKTDRWGMRSEAYTHQGTGVRAIQGMVQYAIGKIDISKMGPELQALTAMPLDLFFPIGELAVAASRETLQLDPVTVANITKALENVYHGLVAETKKEIDKCQQPWEARLLIFRLENAPGTGKIIKEAFNQGKLFGTYKNFVFADKKPTVNELDYFHTQIYLFKHNSRSVKYAGKSFVFTRLTSELRTLAAHELQTGVKKQKDFDREFAVANDVTFVINDLKFGGEKYVHFFLQEADDNKTTLDPNDSEKVLTQAKTVAYLFSRSNKDQTVAQVIKEATAMVQKLGNPPTILMSELKARYSQFCDIKMTTTSVPREKRDIVELNVEATGIRRRSRYSYSDTYGSVAWCNIWRRSENQPSGVKYYVVVVDNKATECGFNKAAGLIEFVKNVQKANVFGLDEKTPIYGLKIKSPLRALTTEWVELTNHVMTSVPKIMTRSKELEMTLILKPFGDCREWDDEINAIAADKKFPATSPMKVFADDLAIARKRAKSDENQKLMDVLNEAKRRTNPATQKPFYTTQNVVNFENAWASTVKLYPMLTLSSHSWRATNAKKVIMDYIRMMDAAREAAEKLEAEKNLQVEVALAAVAGSN